MSNDFPKFGRMVADSFKSIIKGEAFVTGGASSGDDEANVDQLNAEHGDKLYARYLSAFPEGTDPIFKTRSEHDCSCCKSFIRHVANVVGIKNGKIKTIWDEAAEKAPHPYNVVAASLRDLVLDAKITNIFRVGKKQVSFGADKTRSLDKLTQTALTWNHFHTGPLPASVSVEAPATEKGDYRTRFVEVFKRGLEELTPEALEATLSLIDATGDAKLYRGDEYRSAVVDFQKAQQEYNKLNEVQKSVYVWTNAKGPGARLRNIAIGQLVQDLSPGKAENGSAIPPKDIDRAVESFERMVAPANFKRTTAVISPMMVKNAMATIAELGLEPALERRFARIDDITVNDVLWADSATKSVMRGGLGDMLMEHAKSSKNTEEDEKRAEDIDLDSFIKKVLPETTSMELFFKGSHASNLMSLTAPTQAPLGSSEPQYAADHPPSHYAPAIWRLFKWTNDFAWSYNGNVADSIKERVKKAGGKVDAPLRVSLAWHNGDDLDLHVYEPQSSLRGRLPEGNHIGYNTPYRKDRGNNFSPLGGQLDVDMNAGSATNSSDPVENIYWKTVHPGNYKVQVHQYNKRSNSDVGFTIEIECNGKTHTFSYNKAVRANTMVNVVEMNINKDGVPSFNAVDDALTATAVSQDKWALKTETYVKVNAVTLSPNFWGGNAVGHKHTFFFLEGAKSDQATRGIYNEFLHPRLEAHRKVFEIIGEKTKCQPTEGQLSGLGFSSTKQDSVLVKVTQGKKQRLFNVKTIRD